MWTFLVQNLTEYIYKEGLFQITFSFLFKELSSATSSIPPAMTVLRCWCWCLATLCTRVRKEGIVMLQIELGISCIGILSETSRDISGSPAFLMKICLFIIVIWRGRRSQGHYYLSCMLSLGKENEAKKGFTWLESGQRRETFHLPGLYWSDQLCFSELTSQSGESK